MVKFLGEGIQNKYKAKLKKIFTYQKKSQSNIFADNLVHGKPLMLDMNAPNVYQINVYLNMVLPIKHRGASPSIFFNEFSKINRNYPTSFKISRNYTIPKSAMKLANFAISRRGLILWYTVLGTTLKEIESPS